MTEGPPTSLPVRRQGPPREIVRVRPAVPVDDDTLIDLPDWIEWNSVVWDNLEYPRNLSPHHPDFPRDLHFWRRRTLDQITGVTIHHTGGDWTWQQVAWYHAMNKGWPTIQYTHWVEPGLVLETAFPEWVTIHDHTGGKPTTLAVVLRGDFSKEPPTDEHIETTAWLVRWLMLRFDLPLAEIRGHGERAIEPPSYVKTVCPGWGWDIRGGAAAWRGRFFEVLEGIL